MAGKRDYADFGYESNEPDDAPDFDQYEDACTEAHGCFMEGVEETEGVITTHDPQTSPRQLDYDDTAVISDDLDFNPSVSAAQQRLMGAAYGRAKMGQSRASDPHMPIAKLREFARKPRR